MGHDLSYKFLNKNLEHPEFDSTVKTYLGNIKELGICMP